MDKLNPPTAKRPEKLDKLETFTLYSLTVAPSDNKQGIEKKLYKERWSTARKHIQKMFDECGLNATYYYFVEEMSIPENDLMPRYHTHGYIFFETKEACQFFLLELLPIISYTNKYSFKKVDDFEKWWEYCHKQHMLGEITNIFYPIRTYLLHIYTKGDEAYPQGTVSPKVRKRIKKKP